MWIENVALAKALHEDHYLRIMGFPLDLPDLARLTPPGGNSRPEGVAKSFFARKQCGDLPPTC
jgi:hypothetical protein